MSHAVEAGSTSVEAAHQRLKVGRWWQLALGVICMVMIANLQYSWTLVVTPVASRYHWDSEVAQIAFTIFVLLEAWLVPVGAWLVDRFGPRVVVVIGGALCALGGGMSPFADSLPFLYIACGIAGFGASAVYGACVGNALKWFPERRGLAVGITAAGAGATAAVLPLKSAIESFGYEATFLWYGIGQGAVILLIGLLLSQPDANAVAALPKPPAMLTNWPQFNSRQMVKTPVFWIMYVMFVLMSAVQLFVTVHLKNLGKTGEYFKLLDVQPLPLSTVTAALFFGNIMNDLTRPFFGWVSDRVGRENTMFIAFGLEAIAIVLLSEFGTNPGAFVVLSVLVFFASGEIYSLLPSTSADTYGWKHAAANAGWLYTARGIAVFFAPIAFIQARSASWHTEFLIAATMSGLAAVMALVVLKPLRQRMLQHRV